MIENLLLYQEEEAKLRALKKEIFESEEYKKTATAKKYLTSVEENVNKLDDKARSIVAQYEKMLEEEKKNEEFIKELTSAIDNMKDEGEGAYLLKKIDTVSAKIKLISDNIKQIAAEMRGISQEYSNIKKLTEKAKEQYVEYNEKYKALMESKKEEKESIEKNLKKLAKDVAPDLMEKYVKKREAKVFPIITYTKGDSCGICNIGFSLSDQSKLKNGDILECPQCGGLNFKK